MAPTLFGYDQEADVSLPDDVSDQLDQVARGNASAYVAEALRDKITRDRTAQRIREVFGAPDPQAYRYWVERFTAELPAQDSGEGPPAFRPPTRPRQASS